MMTLADKPLEQQLGCFGYFGFASGIQLVLLPRADDNNGALYCNRCPKATACWTRHRARVRELLPNITAHADGLAKTFQGEAYIREFARQSGQSIENVQEPYLIVMMGNMEDGTAVAHETPPKDRSTCTLTWPLTVLS